MMATDSGSSVRRPFTAADVMTAGEVAELLHMPTSTVEHLARQRPACDAVPPTINPDSSRT